MLVEFNYNFFNVVQLNENHFIATEIQLTVNKILTTCDSTLNKLINGVQITFNLEVQRNNTRLPSTFHASSFFAEHDKDTK